MKASTWLKSEKHQQLLERWWVVIVITWDFIKSIAVDKTFSKYGVNPFIYLGIVLVLAIPYAHVTAKMLFAIVANHWRKAGIYGAAALVLHFIPDIYILVTAKSVPRRVFDSFIFIIAIFTFFGVREVVSKIREHRK
ncbi:MAG: hypothetical protein ACKOXI_05275 [Candidatus Planktophila sp.]